MFIGRRIDGVAVPPVDPSRLQEDVRYSTRWQSVIHGVTDVPGVPVWCGGVLEPGIGRATNIALVLAGVAASITQIGFHRVAVFEPGIRASDVRRPGCRHVQTLDDPSNETALTRH